MLRVIHAVSIMNRAGQETFLMNVYRNINRNNVQFDFQCTVKQQGDYDNEILNLGGNILYLPENKIKLPFLKYIGDIIAQYRFFKRHKEYEVFHIHTYHAFDAWLCIVGAKFGGVKRIFLHSHNTSGMHTTLHRVFRWLLKVLNIERLACSEPAGEWMFGEKEMKLHKVQVINNGIDAESFAYRPEVRKERRKQLNLQDKFVIGHIGRFTKQKNHTFLIDIFEEVHKKNDKSVLILIGTGELEEEIRNKVVKKNLSDSVCFLGVREDIPDLLAVMDVFLFPSLYEGLSVVAIEAQAAGVPIVTSDTLAKETKITECLQFVPLTQTAKSWAEKVIEYEKEEHRYTTEEIQMAGYDIKKVARKLEAKYMLRER